MTDSSYWLRDFKISEIDGNQTMEPCAEDDPRVTGFPCWSNHAPKQRNNQYAAWATCMRCGLRTQYVAKRGYAGENRQMGPVPHTIREVMESLARDMKPEDVNEKIVNGRLMEAQGRMLQMGVTNTMAINMSYADYLRRMGRENEKPSSSTKMSHKLTKEIQENATKELINHLEVTAAGQASAEAVELVKKAAESLKSTSKAAAKMKSKAKAVARQNQDVLSSPDWELAGAEDLDEVDDKEVHVIQD